MSKMDADAGTSGKHFFVAEWDDVGVFFYQARWWKSHFILALKSMLSSSVLICGKFQCNSVFSNLVCTALEGVQQRDCRLGCERTKIWRPTFQTRPNDLETLLGGCETWDYVCVCGVFLHSSSFFHVFTRNQIIKPRIKPSLAWVLYRAGYGFKDRNQDPWHRSWGIVVDDRNPAQNRLRNTATWTFLLRNAFWRSRSPTQQCQKYWANAAVGMEVWNLNCEFFPLQDKFEDDFFVFIVSLHGNSQPAVTGGGTVGRIQWDPARCLDWGKSGQPEKHTETCQKELFFLSFSYKVLGLIFFGHEFWICDALFSSVLTHLLW